jgi:hypothetical protein
MSGTHDLGLGTHVSLPLEAVQSGLPMYIIGQKAHIHVKVKYISKKNFVLFFSFLLQAANNHIM